MQDYGKLDKKIEKLKKIEKINILLSVLGAFLCLLHGVYYTLIAMKFQFLAFNVLYNLKKIYIILQKWYLSFFINQKRQTNLFYENSNI